MHFKITLLDHSLSYRNLSASINAPDNKEYYARNLEKGYGTFVPKRIGMHEIVVKYEGENVSSGHYFRILPCLIEIAPPGMAPCALGSIVQVLVNATGK